MGRRAHRAGAGPAWADIIVNPAAYTAVDKAESDEATAHAVNACAVGVIARWTARHGALLVHYSTDYVFSGDGERPWRKTTQPARNRCMDAASWRAKKPSGMPRLAT
ncbi:dTDP-4-dehydrorhamnose reductase [Chromobacterium violaceum]|uniref:dTDP-4-dehydrorhamnose reductase n=1 Tax=Chromobacterium violaceum TaxID=536 RepID=A0A3S5DLX4_CHRVL|nr:dTDP-4-dehydrorhamnose reductase [Chromobacterium violaceum]